MSELNSSTSYVSVLRVLTKSLLVIKPCVKLEWFQHHQPNDLEQVQELFLEEVCRDHDIRIK